MPLALGACGEERQDANEPKGRYKVEIVEADFPGRQKLAKDSDLRIVVKNADTKTIPNVAVTVRGFDRRSSEPGLADRERPVFVVNGVPASLGGFADTKPAAPRGGETAFTDTWALGKLRAGKIKTFRWKVTAVRGGPYRLAYTVSAGLDGKAKAVTGGGQPATGVFVGTIDDTAPNTKVADDGQTIVGGSP
jgi:hypothetical protein